MEKGAGGSTRIDVRAVNWILGPTLDIHAIACRAFRNYRLRGIPFRTH